MFPTSDRHGRRNCQIAVDTDRLSASLRQSLRPGPVSRLLLCFLADIRDDRLPEVNRAFYCCGIDVSIAKRRDYPILATLHGRSLGRFGH